MRGLVVLTFTRGLAPENGAVRVTIRPAADPAALLPSLTAAVHEISPASTFSYRRMEDDVGEALARERLVAMLALFFGGTGLLLSGVGLYGISQHAVTRQRAEIGIRLALGGPPRVVVRAVLGRVVVLVAIGIAGGLLAAFWLARFAAPLVFGLAPQDPMTLIAAPSILALTAIAAAWLPASRAARIDPADVLRQR